MLQQNSSYANIAVVITLVFISTFLEFFEVYRSNKAAQKLKKLVAVKVTVLREGKEEKVFFHSILPPDNRKLPICSALSCKKHYLC